MLGISGILKPDIFSKSVRTSMENEDYVGKIFAIFVLPTFYYYLIM